MQNVYDPESTEIYGQRILTIVTSIELFVPVLISHSKIKSDDCISSAIFTILVPNNVRKLKQMPSTDVPDEMIRLSIKIVIRAQFSSSIA